MYHLDRCSFEFFHPAQNLSVLQSETLQATSHHSAIGVRFRLSGFATPAGDCRWHVIRTEEPAVIRVDDRSKRWSFARQLRQRGVVVRASLAFERSSTLLHEPQPHDVFEKSIRAVDAAFVGDVQLQSPPGNVRGRNFKSHQRPGARADVSPVRRSRFLSRHGDHCRPRVVRGRSDDVESFAIGLPGNVLSERAEFRARIDNIRKHLRGKTKLAEHAVGPIASRRVEALTRRRVGEFDHFAPTQQPVKKVRNHQKRRRLLH